VAAEHQAAVVEKVRRLSSGEVEALADEHLSIRHDGVPCWTHWIDRAIYDEQGNLVEIQAVGRDVTARKEAESERRALEQRLAQAEKMEAIGALAGGLAHDFNNTLTGILAYADLIRRGAGGDSPVGQFAESIREAAERASELTRNLLTLSHRPPRRLGRCDVREVVESAGRLLRATTPPEIALHLEIGKIPPIEADAGQLTQALINLGLNARDAIQGRGSIELSANVERGATGGEVVLRVSDDGAGIPEDVRPRLFEPFFTTKPPGSGTGLGLAMVYACATAHGGRVTMSTEVGRGTSFGLRLPLVHAARTAAAPSLPARGGGETILLVDDEPIVLLHTRMVLERNGYRVLTAGSAEEAVELFAGRLGELSAVVTDLVLPGGSGRELEHAFHSRRPDLPILLATGGFGERGPGEFAALIEKPFSSQDLLRVIREVLERPVAPPVP
jgi:two-component system cell cycle sensor histidine kinase/response regulator CckA